MCIEYAMQLRPNGLAQAFIICETFNGKDLVCLILGDNIFYGIDFGEFLLIDNIQFKGAQIFVYKVPDPQRYGVVEISDEKVISIEEKPSATSS